jgi:hypothetical protein
MERRYTSPVEDTGDRGWIRVSVGWRRVLMDVWICDDMRLRERWDELG